MRISELITMLESMKLDFGDAEVLLNVHDAYRGGYDAKIVAREYREDDYLGIAYNRDTNRLRVDVKLQSDDNKKPLLTFRK